MHPIEPEELMAYLDGELTPDRASEAAQHLSSCRECQIVAGELHGVSTKLLAWPVEEPGPRVNRTVTSARPPEPARPAWRLRTVQFSLVAAGISGMLLLFSPSMRRAPLSQAAMPRRESQMQLAQHAEPRAKLVSQPLIIRTANITLTTSNFSQARTSLEEILKRQGGRIGTMSIACPADSGQTLQATLRVPSAHLDAAMVEIRQLGRVENEQQGGEEVTEQMVDLEARLANSRNTEQRLSDILRHSTGKVTDVLAVENEMGRVRGSIEQMEAERKNLNDRVSFSTLEVRINEEYKAHLATSSPSTLSRLRNAAVEGYRNTAGSLSDVAMGVLSYGPPLLLWTAPLFFPGRYPWRRFRRSA